MPAVLSCCAFHAVPCCAVPCHARTHPFNFQERDPIERIKKLLLTNGVEAADLKRIDKDVKKEVDTAVEAAKLAPIPPDHWRHRNVYGDPTNCSLRLIDGSYIKPDFDPTYST
jgi:pyruvate dehydrogenase E1 component alpha subunit